MSIRVGIVGISSFGGGEAMRLVASHPSFELIYAAGEGSAGSRLVDRFPGVPAKLAEAATTATSRVGRMAWPTSGQPRSRVRSAVPTRAASPRRR